jgi:16S rRNA (uracil1498-N3)-methyltransferase
MRIYLPPELISQKTGIVLPPGKGRHIATVMRYRAGDEFIVVDGAGKAYRATITSIENKEVKADIIEETAPPPPLPFHLALCPGLLKGEKMDFVVQKATELGTREIIPIITERCQVRETGKTGRWQKIAEESVEQCGGVFLPIVHEPVQFSRFIAEYCSEEDSGGLIFMEDWGRPADEALDIRIRSMRRIQLLIGPEGGFTPAELAMAEGSGFVRATLGSSILRAETACISALAITRFVLERGINSG